jgi:hypothetical protein
MALSVVRRTERRVLAVSCYALIMHGCFLLRQLQKQVPHLSSRWSHDHSCPPIMRPITERVASGRKASGVAGRCNQQLSACVSDQQLFTGAPAGDTSCRTRHILCEGSQDGRGQRQKSNPIQSEIQQFNQITMQWLRIFRAALPAQASLFPVPRHLPSSPRLSPFNQASPYACLTYSLRTPTTGHSTLDRRHAINRSGTIVAPNTLQMTFHSSAAPIGSLSSARPRAVRRSLSLCPLLSHCLTL